MNPEKLIKQAEKEVKESERLEWDKLKELNIRHRQNGKEKKIIK